MSDTPTNQKRKKNTIPMTIQKDSERRINPDFTHQVLETNYDKEKVVDILQNLRGKIYKTTNLGPFLDNDQWREFQATQENIMNEHRLKYLDYMNKLPNFDLPSNVGMGRSKSERMLGGKTADQCNYVIGKYFSNAGKEERSKKKNGYNTNIEAKDWKTKNFVDDDKNRCWLCSKPLWVNDLVITPQSEHKSPCYLMALTATGLAYTCRRKHPDSVLQNNNSSNNNGRTYSSEEIPEDVYKDDKDALKQLRTWKLLVRGEGMAWSHAYCNNLKSQTPFVSLKKITQGDNNYYMYIIEFDNIKKYIKLLWSKENLDSKMPMSVQNLKKTRDNNLRTFFNKNEEQIAINNIIKRLIPLVCLLNQGSDIYHGMYKYCSDLLKTKNNSNERTISTLLRGEDNNTLEQKRKLSIENRIYQNCVRIVAANGCTKGSVIYKIANQSSKRSRTLFIEKLINDLFGNRLNTIQEVNETDLYDSDGKEMENNNVNLSQEEEDSLKFYDTYTTIQMDDHACDVGNSEKMNGAKKRRKRRSSSKERRNKYKGRSLLQTITEEGENNNNNPCSENMKRIKDKCVILGGKRTKRRKKHRKKITKRKKKRRRTKKTRKKQRKKRKKTRKKRRK